MAVARSRLAAVRLTVGGALGGGRVGRGGLVPLRTHLVGVGVKLKVGARVRAKVKVKVAPSARVRGAARSRRTW